MLGILVSFFALAVAFGALWFAGEANKRAEFQHKKFYDSHVRGLSETVKVMVRTVKDISGSVQKLSKEVDLLADDEETSKAVMAKLRLALLHSDFPGRKCISGNLAIPFSPSDIPVGETYEFNLWHIMEIDDPLEPFPIEMVDL